MYIWMFVWVLHAVTETCMVFLCSCIWWPLPVHPSQFIVHNYPANQCYITYIIDKALLNEQRISNYGELLLQSGPVHCGRLWWWILLHLGSSDHEHHACSPWWWFHSELPTAPSIILLAGHKRYRPGRETVESKTRGNVKHVHPPTDIAKLFVLACYLNSTQKPAWGASFWPLMN